MSVSQTLRNAVNVQEGTLYRVAKDTGISWATMKRFVEGGGLRSEHIDKLASYFGLELRPVGKPAKDKVKAPAVPAVDWATAEPKKKAKAIPMPGGQVLEKPTPAVDRPVPKKKANRKR
jgi:hypothetical protein